MLAHKPEKPRKPGPAAARRASPPAGGSGGSRGAEASTAVAKAPPHDHLGGALVRVVALRNGDAPGASIDRAAATTLVQRQHTKTAPEPAKDDSQVPMGWEWNPAAWARRKAPLVKSARPDASIIVTLATNTSYAFDADGGSLREIPVRLPERVRGSSVWRLDVAHARWGEFPIDILRSSDLVPPLPEQDVKALCDAMGGDYGGSKTLWVVLLIQPDLVFARPEPANAKAKTSGDTPAMRRKAKEAVRDLTDAWRDRPPPTRSALVGTPTFKQRYSERTGWHVRITLDQEITEVPLREGDTDNDVRKRVDAAVAKLRAKYDGAQAAIAKPPGWKSNLGAPAPPPWYVPFESHPAVQDGRAIANAPPLPAVVLFKPDPSNTHPTVMAGAIYDFKMQVQWQFAGHLEGLSAVGNAGYYWELLAASPSDWYRLSGEAPPAGTPTGVGGAQPTAASGAGPSPASARTEDNAVGSGTRVTRKDDATSSRKAEGRHVGEDMVNDYEEGDYTGLAGEAVAGGFRIVKTQVISTISDILDRRDRSNRRVRFEEPGYYLVRCVSQSTTADEDSEWVRSPSVAVIPVKVQLNWGVAKASAKADQEKMGGKGTFARYLAELSSSRATLTAAKRLQARFIADPSLRGRLASDPVSAASTLTVLELGVLTLADLNKTSVEQLVKDLTAQVDQAAGDKQEKTATAWHGELKKAPDGVTDYPVGGSFVVEDTGQQIQLRLMVGQAQDSTDAAPHWIVFDITSAKTRDRYEGRAIVAGTPLPAEAGGHGMALRQALHKFAGENPYGYGEIGLAWPESFGKVNLTGSDLPRHLRSAPNAATRKKNRRRAYVDIATLLIPVAKAAQLKRLVKAAEAFAALAGAGNAIDALKDRARTRHLDEPGTLLELVQVVGGLKTIGEGGRFVLEANELVQAARRVGSSLELLTKLENAVQIITIPFEVRDQLKAIDAMTGASAEHKAATLAFVLGKAIRSGVVSVRAIHPGEQTVFYDDSKVPDGGTPDPRRTGAGGGSGGGAGGGGGGSGGAIPPSVHRDLQQFADVHRIAIIVRRVAAHPDDPQHAEGRLGVEVQWAGTLAGKPPPAMTPIQREAYTRMLESMNIGVVGSDVTTGAALARIDPTPTSGKKQPSQSGSGQDVRIEEGLRPRGSHYDNVFAFRDAVRAALKPFGSRVNPEWIALSPLLDDADIKAANPGLLKDIRCVHAALRDTDLVEQVMVDVWERAARDGITTTEALIRMAGRGGKLPVIKKDVLTAKRFKQVIQADRPFLDEAFTDYHGVYSHAFQELVVAKKLGSMDAARDFRHLVAAATDPNEGDMKFPFFSKVWDALYDSTAFENLNSPEGLGPILHAYLGLPGPVRPPAPVPPKP